MTNKNTLNIALGTVLISIIALLFYSVIFSGKQCGGFMGTGCPLGYNCGYADNYPDASGQCRFDPIFTIIELLNKLR